MVVTTLTMHATITAEHPQKTIRSMFDLVNMLINSISLNKKSQKWATRS